MTNDEIRRNDEIRMKEPATLQQNTAQFHVPPRQKVGIGGNHAPFSAAITA